MSANQGNGESHNKQVALAAQTMCERYGARASVEAALRTEELEMAGDFDSAAMWREITRVIHITDINTTRQ